MNQTNKPGWQTTEFWLTFIAHIVGFLSVSGLLNTNKEITILAMAASILSQLGYTASRTYLKGKETAVIASVAPAATELTSTSAESELSSEPDEEDFAKANGELDKITKQQSEQPYAQKFPDGVVEPFAVVHFTLHCPAKFQATGLAVAEENAKDLVINELKIGSEDLLPAPVSAICFPPDYASLGFQNAPVASDVATITVAVKNISDKPVSFTGAIVGTIYKNLEG